MLRDDTDNRFLFGPTIFRLIPNNPDGGKALPTRVVGGVGPFDFSGAAVPAAVTITLKIDNTEISDTLDLSALTLGAVTAAELVTAFTAASISGYTASVESGTNRFKIVKTTPGSARYLQIGGEVGLYAGMPGPIIVSDNQKSIAFENINKDSEVIETIDSNGLSTSINTDGYPTGATVTITNANYDLALTKAVVGGELVDDGFTEELYESPGASTEKPIFTIETINSMWSKDANQAGNQVGYRWRRYNNCKGITGGEAGDRNFQDGVLTITAVPYRDPITGTKDVKVYSEQKLTTTEYEALHFETV